MSDIGSVLGAYFNPYNSYPGLFDVPATESGSYFDFGNVAAEDTAMAMLKLYNGQQEGISALKSDTVKYLNDYAAAMEKLDQSAGKLRLGGLDKLLYDADGKITDKTADSAVDAVNDMVKDYNDTLKLLNDNADRGSGTAKQLRRMEGDPAAEEDMKKLGITVNDDGSLKLDEDKLKKALTTDDANALREAKQILGGIGGIADGIHQDAQAGRTMSSRELINADLSQIRILQKENPFTEMYMPMKAGAYGLINQEMVGMLMNEKA